MVLLSGVSSLLTFTRLALATGFSSTMVQETFNIDSGLDQWQITLSADWDVLGPFPIHAREQHFISPGFPLNLSGPYHHEPDKSWPSSLSENAEVHWRKARSDPNGNLAVSFPDIRWGKVRATEGWASLQHHTVLRTMLTIRPPRSPNLELSQPRIRVALVQGSFFSILPRESAGIHPEWHTGNIYGMNRATPTAVELPGIVHTDKPTVFDFVVSGDYEGRSRFKLFGDPRDTGEETPTLRINVVVRLEDKHLTVVRQESHDVLCDFVNGYAFGDAMGVGLSSVDGWWTVDGIELPEQFPKSLSLNILHKQCIAPSQTRIIPISIKQSGIFDEKSISFNLLLSESHEENKTLKPRTISIPITIALRHLEQWDASRSEPVRATFFFASSHPTYFLAKPPVSPRSEGHSVPLLALHGAGVDIISAPFWADSLPRQKYSWIVMPVGCTEWGLDWHGPSASEAWGTLTALSKVLHRRTEWKSWAFPQDSSAVIVGHSNGGQGAWYLASRFPDRAHAALPAAGYLSPAAYVPLTRSRGARFADPALRSVLESSFMPDDNALFLGNLADTVPVLAVHGGNDTNVPTWHSREYVSIIKSWGKGLNVSFQGDEGQPHWYPSVFESAPVRSFLGNVLDSDVQTRVPVKEVSQFTLTVADPVHTGSMHGCTIDELVVPGRLARLHVELRDDSTYIKTTNTCKFSIPSDSPWLRDLVIIDGTRLQNSKQEVSKKTFSVSKTGTWNQENASLYPSLPLPPGRVQNILDTPGSITIVLPSESHSYPSRLSAALRISHALDLFLKIDCEITLDTDALHLLQSSSDETRSMRHRFQGSVIILGGSENALSRRLLQVPQSERRTEFGISDSGEWLFRGRSLSSADQDLGVLFTHPHPVNPSGVAVILAGTSNANGGSSESIERVLRLFFPRTGIAVPDWIIVGKEVDQKGAGGVIGAGVWNSSWKWSESMSYLAW